MRMFETARCAASYLDSHFVPMAFFSPPNLSPLVRTNPRRPPACSIPSVQTIDDLMVEKCQPGDVILFDRRCECCAAGPAAAAGCLLGKAILCDESDGTPSVEGGSYEHCGE